MATANQTKALAAMMQTKGPPSSDPGGDLAARQGAAAAHWTIAFVVSGAAVWSIWAYLRRADRARTLALDTALAERLATAESLTAATERKREKVRAKAIGKADAWAALERAALFSRRCAKASWMFTLSTIPLTACGNSGDPGLRFPMSTFGCLILLAAIGLAIFALTRISRHGRKGLLAPATITLVANALFIGFAVWGILDRR